MTQDEDGNEVPEKLVDNAVADSKDNVEPSVESFQGTEDKISESNYSESSAESIESLHSLNKQGGKEPTGRPSCSDCRKELKRKFSWEIKDSDAKLILCRACYSKRKNNICPDCGISSGRHLHNCKNVICFNCGSPDIGLRSEYADAVNRKNKVDA